MMWRVLVRVALRTLSAVLLVAVGMGPLLAQGAVQGITGPAGGPRAAETPPVNPASDPLLRGFQWRSIGPLTMGGRADEVAVVESDIDNRNVVFAAIQEGLTAEQVIARVTDPSVDKNTDRRQYGVVTLNDGGSPLRSPPRSALLPLSDLDG